MGREAAHAHQLLDFAKARNWDEVPPGLPEFFKKTPKLVRTVEAIRTLAKPGPVFGCFCFEIDVNYCKLILCIKIFRVLLCFVRCS